MNTTLYLDLFSGVSGDMFVGALLDLGIDFDRLQAELRKLPLDDYHLHWQRRHTRGIVGVKFDVHLTRPHDHVHGPEQGPANQRHTHTTPDLARPDPHPHRDFAQIQQLIQGSGLSDWVQQRAVAVFRRIAVAEGQIHGMPPDRVHFHEVGAVDSIVDIVGACIALEQLGRPRVLASTITEGTGWVDCAHGRFPLPTPATLAILGQRGAPISQCAEPNELVTPTGAALLAEFAESFGPMRSLVARKIGYGLGSRENQTRPNLLRVILGDSVSTGTATHDWETDTISVLESNLDDINAEWLGHFVQRALDAGALDVFHTPVQMKKNRPGVLLTVLCKTAAAERFAELILRETTSFGVRLHTVERRKLRRETGTVRTPFGEVTVKRGLLNGEILHVTPEYESCRAVAEQAAVPLKAVYQAVAGIAPAP